MERRGWDKEGSKGKVGMLGRGGRKKDECGMRRKGDRRKDGGGAEAERRGDGGGACTVQVVQYRQGFKF